MVLDVPAQCTIRRDLRSTTGKDIFQSREPEIACTIIQIKSHYPRCQSIRTSMHPKREGNLCMKSNLQLPKPVSKILVLHFHPSKHPLEQRAEHQFLRVLNHTNLRRPNHPSIQLKPFLLRHKHRPILLPRHRCLKNRLMQIGIELCSLRCRIEPHESVPF